MMTRKKRLRTQLQGKVANTSAECAPQDELRERVKGRSTLHEISTAQGAEFRLFFRWLATNHPDDARSWPAEYARRYEIIAAARERGMEAAKQALPENPEDATHEQLAALFRTIAEFDIASCVTRHAWEVDERLRDLPQVDAVILEAALVEIDDTMRRISFWMRDRINNPLFPGHDSAMLFDLSGLIAEKTAVRGDLWEALAETGSTKYEALPVAILEMMHETKVPQDFEHFRNRAGYVVIRDEHIPKVSRQETVQNDAGEFVKQSKRVRRDIPEASLLAPLKSHSVEGDVSGAYDELLRRAKKLSPQYDGFSDHALDLLELAECLKEANLTARKHDMLKRKAVLGDSSKEIAADYGVTVSTVNNTNSQTHKTLRTARASDLSSSKDALPPD